MYPLQLNLLKPFKFFARIAIVTVILLTLSSGAKSQNVNVTSTAGTFLSRSYISLKLAFDAINNGDHQGVITVSVVNNTNEGTTPAVLNSGDAFPASYTSVAINAGSNAVSVSGTPAAGFGVIELNGADNVTINGDNPSTGGIARNLTINNNTTSTNINNSVIRIATSLAVTSANNISIKNLILNGNVTNGNDSTIINTNTQSNLSYGIYVGGEAGVTEVSAPSVINATDLSQSALSGTTINNLNIDNNQIDRCGRGIMINSSNASVMSDLIITNNTIGNSGSFTPPYRISPATTVYVKGIVVSGTNSVVITRNTVKNIISFIGTSLAGIELGSNNGSGTIRIDSNTVNTIISNTNTAGNSGNISNGISVNSVNGQYSITGNEISNIETYGNFFSASGIEINANGAAGIVSLNKIYQIYGRNQSSAFGITLRSAGNSMQIQNNFIYNLQNNPTIFNIARVVAGINIASGSNHKIYHNSIHLYGSTAVNSPNIVTCLITRSAAYAGLDIRNNIFSNERTTPNTLSVHSCLYMTYTPAQAAASLTNMTLNNNAYYTGSTVGVHGVGYYGTSYVASQLFSATDFIAGATTPATNWRSYSSVIGDVNNDNVSIATTGDAPFNSDVDLHINAVSSPLESGGADLDVTIDIDNETRNPNTPDIGADEFITLPVDNFPPTIAAQLLPDCNPTQLLFATINDASGVVQDATGSDPACPQLYWKIGVNGTYQATPGFWQGENLYLFIFGGGVVNDTIYYYIVAQDQAATPNVVAFPSVGAGGYTTSIPAAATPPTVPLSYINRAALNGTYQVGPTAPAPPVGFPNLTAAVAAYNTACLQGPVTFLLQSNYSSATETFPIVINQNSFANNVNTLTIKPAVGANPIIEGGSPEATIKLNGADYVTIDGSNVANGTTRNMIISNNNVGNTASTIWIASASTTNGSTYNVIKNCDIKGNVDSLSQACITSSSGLSLSAATQTPNNNNTITNNRFRAALFGINILGKSTTNRDSSWLINNNDCGNISGGGGTAAGGPSDLLGRRGISISNAFNFTISGNNISNVVSPFTYSSEVSGIFITGNSENGNIFKNKISHIRSNSTNLSAYSLGISLGSGSSNSNINVYNNMIWDIYSRSNYTFSPSFNSHAVFLRSGGGYNLFYNTISLNINQNSTTGGVTSCIYISGVTGTNTLRIANNIISNTQSSGRRYAIYSNTALSAYALLDNNNYFVSSGGNVGFIGSLNRPSLLNWQTATGPTNDINSVSLNSSFVSIINDLHVNNTSPLNGLGRVISTPISITTDIDEQARNATRPDIGADEFTAPNCSVTAGASITVSVSNICVGGSGSLIGTGFQLGEGMSYQWEKSTGSATGPWSNLTNGTNPNGAPTGFINQTTWFRLTSTCSFSGTSSSNVVVVNVFNPSISGLPDTARRCGPGTVTITGTPSANSVISWYSVPTGGSPIGTGSPFVTPLVTGPTTFYASARTNPPVYIPNLVNTYNYSTDTTAVPDTLIGGSVQTLVPSFVDDNPSAVFNIGFTFNFNNTEYTQFSASPDGWILMGGNPAVSQFSNSINSTTNIPKIAAFWDDMATGGNGSVKSLLFGSAPNRILKVQWIGTTTNNHPSGLANFYYQAWLYEGSNKIEFYYGTMGSISSGASIGLTGSLGNYQSVTFSDHSVSTTAVNNANNGIMPSGRRYTFTPPVCESPRVAVPVAISTPPAINTPTATPSTICDGESTTLNVTSSHAPYTYVWTPGNISGASQTLFPTSTTIYTVTATDNTIGNTFSGCANIATVQVNVNRSPTIINVVSTADSICAGQTVNLSATGGLIQGDNIYTSGAVNLVIPDAGCSNPAISAIAVPVLPPGAVVDSVIVELNTTSGSGTNPDLVFQIQAPNGQILTLKSRGASGTASGNNFTGTRFTSNSTAPPLLSGTAPYTGTFSGDYQPTASGVTCASTVLTPQPTVTTWAALLTQINGNWSLICHDAWGGFVATLTNWSIKIAYTAPSLYNWTSIPATTITGTPSAPTVQVSATPVASTSFIATVSNGTCSRRDTATVVIRQPVATVSINQAPSGAICPGTSVTFTATPTNGGTSPTYQWFNGASAIAGATSATYITNTLTNGSQISCKIKSNAACVNPATEWTSNTINVTVNPNLPADVTILSNDTDSTICPGTSVTFTATPTNGGAAPVYQWQLNGSNVGTNSPTYITTGLNNGDIVRVIMTSNATPCLTNSPDTSNPIPFTVIPSAPVSVTITGDNNGQTICVGSEVNFTAIPVNGGTTPIYQWQVNGSNVGTNSPTYTSSSLNNNDQVRVILTSNANCALTNPDTSNVITMTVTNNAQAVVTLSSGTPCLGQTVTLTANPTNQGTAPVYQFFINTVQVQSGSGATYTYTPTSGDEAFVVLTSNILCPDPNVDSSNIITITNASAPVVDATTNCTTLLTGSDQQATLTVTATTATGTITGYQWFQNGTSIPGATSTTYTTPTTLAAGTHNYTVNVTNSNGCVTIDTVVITSAPSALTPGIYTIPSTTCSGFPTIAKAVTYLNANGINTSTAGGIIFDITPGYAETSPAGGFRITRSGGANNQVIFRKGIGVGDVTVTAFTPQVAGQIYDAIFKLVGADYITIRGLKLQENPANFTIAADTVTLTNKMTEWGIALLKASATDGAQYDSIDNNTITLNRNYQNSFGIYSSSHHAETTPATSATSSSIAGLNSFNKVLNNTISNVNFGISFACASFSNNFDSLNIIGSAGNGNTITNWGRSSYRATAFAGVPATSLSAIISYNQVGESVIGNNITTTLLAADSLIRVNTTVINKTYNAIPTSSFTTNINSNIITLNAEASGITRTFTLEGIRSGWTGTALAPATININDNTMSNWNVALKGIPTFNMIVNQAIVTNLNINNNIIKSISSNATGAGTFTGINNTANVVNLSIQGNQLGGALVADSIFTNSGPVSMISATGTNTLKNVSSNTISGVRGQTSFTGITVSSAPTTSVNTNSIIGVKAGASASKGMTISGATPAHILSLNNNILNGISASAALTGIEVTATGTNSISGNSITSLTMNSISGNLIGIQAAGTHTTRNNTISSLTAAVAGSTPSIYGILQAGSTAGIIDSNRISQLTSNANGGNATTSGVINGIIVFSGSNLTIRKNQLSNFRLLRQNTTSSINGILINGSSIVTATNNFISDLRADSSQNPDGIRGISVPTTTANANYYFYYNTIFLNASSVLSGFGSSGVYHAASATATTANLVLRNNIITNISTPSGAGVVFNTVTPNNAGLTVALRRSAAAFANYGNSPVSNFNAFYAGVPASNRLLYFNVTTSAQTLTAMRAAFSPSANESTSIAVLPQFVNSSTTPYDLHLVSNLNCNLEGTGNNSIILVPDDFDGDVRLTGTPTFITDIGADEFTGTTNASPVITSQPSSATQNPCLNGTATALSVTATGVTVNSVANGGLSYQWYSNTVASNTGGTLIANATSSSYTPSTTTAGTTYYYVIVNDSCASAPTTSSVSGAITVRSNTTITTEPTATVSVCQDATATAVSVAATGDGTLTYQWFSNTTNTYTGATSLGATAQTASYTPPVTTAGTTYYFVIVTGTCGSDTSVRVTYTVNALPIEPTFIDGERCGPGIVSISATPSAGETVSWFTTPTGGTSIGTGSPFNTPNINVTTFYFAEAVNSTTGCRSAIRSLVSANIVSTPTTSLAGPDQNLCSTSATLAANTATSGTGVWSVISGAGGTFGNSASPSTTFTGVSGTTYTLAWTISNSPCPASVDNVVVTLTAPPTGALSGVYYVPSSPLNDCRFFSTISEAVTYLNNNGLSGATTIKVAAGYTETLTATLALGSTTLNASTSATNKLRFEKNGAGANPLVTAYIGGTNNSNTAAPDGLWSLRGVDYVTIDGIDLQENGSNINVNTQMEYGYGLFKASATDGAQNDTIKNCTITLNRNNFTGSTNFLSGSVGIAMTNATATAATTPLVVTALSGANSNNIFFSNNIQNAHYGIGVIGFAAASTAAFGDAGNKIGDTSVSTSGNILNVGGAATANNVSYGVFISNQFDAQIGYNNITGAAHNSNQTGIRTENNTGATGIGISKNTISITGGADRNYAGIDNSTGGGTGSSVNIEGNTVNVTMPSSISISSTLGSILGIRNATVNPIDNIKIRNNNFSNSNVTGTGAWTGISNTANSVAVGGTIIISNNTLSNNRVLSTGTFAGIQNTANTYSSLEMSRNTITGNRKDYGSVSISDISWLKQTSTANSGNLTIENNLIENDSVQITGANNQAVNVNGISLGGVKSASSSNISGNTVQSLSVLEVNSTFVGTLRGLLITNPIGQIPTNEVVSNNKISKLVLSAASGSTATHVLAGIQHTGIGANPRTYSLNRIDTIYVRKNADASPLYNSIVSGIHNASGGSAQTIAKNKISHLIPYASTSASIARGIWIAGGATTTSTIHNNMIDLDMTQAFDGADATSLVGSDAIRGFDISTGSAGPINIYYNTVEIAGSGTGTAFGTSAFSINNGTPVVLFKNNALINRSVAGGTSPGLSVALRRSVALSASYSTSSSNNMFFAGIPSASNLIYFDGTNSFQRLSDLQPTRELNSLEGVNPVFVRGTDNTDSLHMNTSTNCAYNGTATPIPGFTDDVDGDVRSGTTPDIGADEFNTTGLGVGQWAGINTNWNDANNWCGAVPNSTTDVTLTTGRTFYPNINGTTLPVPAVRNLTINSGATINVQANGKMDIFGIITNSGIFNAREGTIELTGSVAQSIPSGAFQNNNLRNLILNNNVTLNGALNVLNKISFKGSNRIFTTNDNLTLKSSDTLTASVGDVTNGAVNSGNNITGNVTVERFVSNIKNGTPSLKTWRLLSMPTKHNLQTIKQAWQENGDSSTVFNPNPGFGTQITTILGGNNGAARALGFDAYSAGGSSSKTYNPVTNQWVNTPTTLTAFNRNVPYLVFVRGSRAKTLFNQIPDSTILREKGQLNIGDTFSYTLGTAGNQFVSVPNPYASAVSFQNLDKTNITSFYYLYDSRLGSNGGYQTVTADGTFITPGGGSYTGGNYNIQSSQGFFVRTNGAAGTILFKETSKVDGSASVLRTNAQMQMFKTSLFKIQNGTADLNDGVVQFLDENASNSVDQYDAEKLSNLYENFGISTNGKALSLETRKPFVSSDTVHYQLNQMRTANYRFEFAPQNIDMNGMEAILIDKFQGTRTPVSLQQSTSFDFTVNSNAGSYASDRFKLIFRQLRPLPVTFVEVKAVRLEKEAKVIWKVANELNISNYTIERSLDGRSFIPVGSVVSSGSNDYSFMDTDPSVMNYYRIRSNGNDGEKKFSQIVKLVFETSPSITIFPNPIKEDGKANIRMISLPQGDYSLILYNSIGQIVKTQLIQHLGGDMIYPFAMPKHMAHGHYTLEINGKELQKTRLKILF